MRPFGIELSAANPDIAVLCDSAELAGAGFDDSQAESESGVGNKCTICQRYLQLGACAYEVGSALMPATRLKSFLIL